MNEEYIDEFGETMIIRKRRKRKKMLKENISVPFKVSNCYYYIKNSSENSLDNISIFCKMRFLVFLPLPIKVTTKPSTF